MHYLFVFWQRSDPAAAHSHSQPRFPARYLQDVVNRRLEFGRSRYQVAEPRRCCDISALYPPSPLTPPWGEGCCRWMKGDQSSVKEIGNSCCLLQRDCFVVLRTGGCIHFGLRLSMLYRRMKGKRTWIKPFSFQRDNYTQYYQLKMFENKIQTGPQFVACWQSVCLLSSENV